MVEKNDINITWIEKTKQIGNILTKAHPYKNPMSYQVYYLLRK